MLKRLSADFRKRPLCVDLAGKADRSSIVMARIQEIYQNDLGLDFENNYFYIHKKRIVNQHTF